MKFKIALKFNDVAYHYHEPEQPIISEIEEFIMQRNKEFADLYDDAKKSKILTTPDHAYSSTIYYEDIDGNVIFWTKIVKYCCKTSLFKVIKFVKRNNLDVNIYDKCIELTYNYPRFSWVK